MIGEKFKAKHPQLAKFIEEKLPQVGNVIGDLLPDKGVLGIVKNLISTDTTLSPEDKAEALKLANEAEELHLKEMTLNNENTDSARKMNVAIEGDKPSWLAKNVGYILDIFVALIWGFLTIYLIVRFTQMLSGDKPKASDAAIMAMWAAVSSQFGTVMNFHRGSSSSARQKDNVIQNIAMQP